MTHPWCRDIARDTAIRAAEDAAASERPALPDHRELPERVARLEAAVFPPKADFPATEKSATQEGGMLVTLEFSNDDAGWRAIGIVGELVSRSESGSIRVVPAQPRVHQGSGVFDASGDEVPLDGIAFKLKEADAEVERLRERLGESESFRRQLSDEIKKIESEVLRLRMVGELLAAESHKAREQRDAALAEVACCRGLLENANKDRNAALARVAELEADKALADQTERNLRSYGEWHSVEGREARAERDALKARVTELEAKQADAEPPPRGWLTEEEREALESARLHLSNFDGFDKKTEQDARWASEIVAKLLARSSPPEVVLPEVWGNVGRDLVMVKSEVIAALAAAGVVVKEVGRD